MDECSICLEAIESQPCTLTCNHCFHSTCMLRAFRNDPRCPICRDAIDVPTDDTGSSVVRLHLSPERDIEDRRRLTMIQDKGAFVAIGTVRRVVCITTSVPLLKCSQFFFKNVRI